MASRGIRNNNPGNIEAGAKFIGRTGSDGRFGKYDSPENGVRALAKQLSLYQSKHGRRTVRQMIERWAPPSENNTTAYVNAVAKAMGVDPDAEFDFSASPDLSGKMVTAIIQHENGSQPYAPETISRGVQSALSVRQAVDTPRAKPDLPGAPSSTEFANTDWANQQADPIGAMLASSQRDPIAGLIDKYSDAGGFAPSSRLDKFMSEQPSAGSKVADEAFEAFTQSKPEVATAVNEVVRNQTRRSLSDPQKFDPRQKIYDEAMAGVNEQVAAGEIDAARVPEIAKQFESVRNASLSGNVSVSDLLDKAASGFAGPFIADKIKASMAAKGVDPNKPPQDAFAERVGQIKQAERSFDVLTPRANPLRVAGPVPQPNASTPSFTPRSIGPRDVAIDKAFTGRPRQAGQGDEPRTGTPPTYTPTDDARSRRAAFTGRQSADPQDRANEYGQSIPIDDARSQPVPRFDFTPRTAQNAPSGVPTYRPSPEAFEPFPRAVKGDGFSNVSRVARDPQQGPARSAPIDPDDRRRPPSFTPTGSGPRDFAIGKMPLGRSWPGGGGGGGGLGAPPPPSSDPRQADYLEQLQRTAQRALAASSRADPALVRGGIPHPPSNKKPQGIGLDLATDSLGGAPPAQALQSVASQLGAPAFNAGVGWNMPKLPARQPWSIATPQAPVQQAQQPAPFIPPPPQAGPGPQRGQDSSNVAYTDRFGNTYDDRGRPTSGRQTAGGNQYSRSSGSYGVGGKFR